MQPKKIKKPKQNKKEMYTKRKTKKEFQFLFTILGTTYYTKMTLLASIRKQLSYFNSVTNPQQNIKAVIEVYVSTEPQRPGNEILPILKRIFQWIYSTVMKVLKDL